jgi:hypothetical protein
MLSAITILVTAQCLADTKYITAQKEDSTVTWSSLSLQSSKDQETDVSNNKNIQCLGILC